ncbi:uncharacterized protein LOC135466592 isoform X2 [Liolophura sinensis]|uniref:uncharacterized protein LOC135466592 isoform X2 n=1 Tax=Liolophura sinensis TaxID=3198878 RepID=UPI003158CE4F
MPSKPRTARHNYYQGPSQTVHLKEGHVYNMETWIKLLNDNGKSQHVQIEVAYMLNNGHTNYVTVANRNPVNSHSGWVHLKGQLVVPTGVKQSRVYFQGPDPGIDFLVDAASLTELHIHSNSWKPEADARIDHYRKSNIHIKVATDTGVNKDLISIDVSQKTHAFPFGTAVVASIINNNNGGSDQKYRQFVFDNYNWAVTANAMKWHSIERVKGQPDYETGETAIKILRSHGLKVRAHNLLWNFARHLPHWVTALKGDELNSVVQKHIHDTVLRYKGLVEHWDVNNEMLHGNYFEDTFHDPDYSKKVFRTVHQLDPNVTLFLNDFSVVSSGGSTNDYLAQAKDYKASDTYVGGLGVQCHFKNKPVPALIKERLDTLSQAGLPIWATELDIMADDEDVRADWYDIAYRMLFSHPSVEGILIWGFWSEHQWRGEKAALVSGPEFRVNAAGQRYLNLVNKEWRTESSHPLSKGTDFTVRGFRGH